MEGSEKVVFAKGEHVFEDTRGTVVVHAPRDVALGEVLPALARLAAASAEGKECGNAA